MFPVVVPLDDIEYDFQQGMFSPLNQSIHFRELLASVLNATYLTAASQVVERLCEPSNYDDVGFYNITTTGLMLDVFVNSITARITQILGGENISYEFSRYINGGVVIMVNYNPISRFSVTSRNLDSVNTRPWYEITHSAAF